MTAGKQASVVKILSKWQVTYSSACAIEKVQIKLKTSS